ncbi:hypothetical protein EXIGLDRAFT_324480 [Exidia glandulosa HHB12029]|uniref:Uncharacterized protein n=1 Tax=Exidia glandulosa HHB12029 TaxID=1314781 RepID=A0A165ZJ61_EXIGL|nr:hypothetical protein EXIGLDRAFT_324480 [Exidia glandulosa HHB12029]
MELTWKPVKIKDLPTADELNGPLIYEQSDAIHELIRQATADNSDGCAGRTTFYDFDTDTPALPVQDDDFPLLLTREERLRAKRPRGYVDTAMALDTHEEDGSESPPHKRFKEATASQSGSEMLFSPILEAVAVTSLPTSSPIEDVAFEVLDSHSHHPRPDVQIEASQFSALSFGTDFAGVSQQLHYAQDDTIMYWVASDKVVEDDVAVTEEPVDELQYEADSPRCQRQAEASLSHADLPTFDLPQSMIDTTNTAQSGVSRFLLFKGMRPPAINPALSARAASPVPAHAVPQAAPAPAPAASGPTPYLPDDVLQMQPLLLTSVSHDFASTPTPQLYLATVDFLQKRALISTLADLWNVDIVDRDMPPGQEYAHIILDCDSW